MRNRKLEWSMGLNGLVTIFGIVGIAVHWMENGWTMFRFYTLDSNLLVTIAAALLFLEEWRALRSRRNVRKGFLLFKYYGVCTVFVTMVMVIAVLCPMMMLGGESFSKAYGFMLLSGGMIWHHMLCPVLAILGFLVYDPGTDLGKPVFQAAGFTLLYGIVVLSLNALRLLEGPYPFLLVYEQPLWATVLWVAVIYMMAAAVAAMIYKIYMMRGRKR